MTQPVRNLSAPLVDKLGKLIPPWNSWFQQFSQNAPPIVDVAISSPYQPNKVGVVIISGQTTVSLTRGPVPPLANKIDLTPGNTQKIIPVSIGDIVSWTGVGPITIQFLEQ
jgi:hypothetical protein